MLAMVEHSPVLHGASNELIVHWESNRNTPKEGAVAAIEEELHQGSEGMKSSNSSVIDIGRVALETSGCL